MKSIILALAILIGSFANAQVNVTNTTAGIQAPAATASVEGVVKPDEQTVFITSGVLSTLTTSDYVVPITSNVAAFNASYVDKQNYALLTSNTTSGYTGGTLSAYRFEMYIVQNSTGGWTFAGPTTSSFDTYGMSLVNGCISGAPANAYVHALWLYSTTAAKFFLDGLSCSTGIGRFTTVDVTGQVVSTLASGTAPFVVASTTQVANLNASQVGGVALSGLCQTGGTGCPTGITGLTQGEPVVGNASGVSTSSPVYYDVSQFAGSTIDAKWNACNTEVLFEGGGTCDARSLALMTAGGSTGLLVGNGTGTPVEFILPTFCDWQFTINNGTASVLTQYAGTSITNHPGVYGCVMTQTVASTSGSTGAYSMYINIGQDYFRAEGFTLENSVALASGFNGIINYAYDNSVWAYIEFNDASGADTAGLRLGTSGGGFICCSTSFYNVTSNSGFTGPTPLDIEGFSSSSYVTSLNFFGGSFDHPKSGVPNIKINDAYHNMSVAFSGSTYAEPGNTSGSITTTPIQISGAADISFQMLNVVPQYAGMTAPVLSIAASGATNTTVNIGSFSSNGLLSAHTVVADSGGWCTFAGATPPCNTSTDIYGNMGSYSNAPTTSLHPIFPLNTQIGSTTSAGFVFTNTYYGIPSGWASVYPFYAGIDVQGNAASSSSNSEFGVSNTSDSFGGHGVGGNEFNVTANHVVTTYSNTLDNGSGAATLVSLQGTPIGSTTASTGKFTTLTDTGLSTAGCVTNTSAGLFGTATCAVSPLSGAITLTTATSDNATITGVTTSSHCVFSPTNTTAAATGTVLAYVSAVAANTVTISHAATVANGATENIVCTVN